jgi:hypothetical protein
MEHLGSELAFKLKTEILSPVDTNLRFGSQKHRSQAATPGWTTMIPRKDHVANFSQKDH